MATRVRSCKLSKTIMTATICFKFGGSRGSSEVWSPLFFEQCASPTADGRGLSWLGYQHHAGYDVVRLRFAAKCWNEGRRYEKMGDIFFQLLHSDLFAKHWYYDDEGFESCTLRYPIVERFRKWEA